MLRIAPNAPKGQVFFRENPDAKLRTERQTASSLATPKQFPRLGTVGGGESDYGPFVASMTRPHFHRPDCKWASYLRPGNMLEFSSHAEAVEAGKKPCKTCRA